MRTKKVGTLVTTNTAEKRLRMREAQKNGEEFKCQIVNKNMAI
jgi:hypothetical protein